MEAERKGSVILSVWAGGTGGGSEGSCAYCGVVLGQGGGRLERIWFRGGFLKYFELAKEYLKRPPQTNRWRDQGQIQGGGLWFGCLFGVCRACEGTL